MKLVSGEFQSTECQSEGDEALQVRNQLRMEMGTVPDFVTLFG